MTINSYFTLADNNSVPASVVSWKFDVIEPGGFAWPVSNKAGSVNITVDGLLDVAVGEITKTIERTVRVRETESLSGYGSLDNLRYFFELNNPGGDPPDIIDFTDYNTSVTYNVKIIGNFEPVKMGWALYGESAYYSVKCLFQVVT